MASAEIELESARTLVLDAGFQPVKVIDWRRALSMAYCAKAEVLASYAWSVHTVQRAYPAPAVIRLLIQHRHRPQVARFSRRNVYIRDEFRCQYCGLDLPAGDLTLDHVVPRVAGGKTTWTNVVAACRPCNRRKGGRTPEQAGLRLRAAPVRPRWSPGLLQPLPERLPEPWRDWLIPAVA